MREPASESTADIRSEAAEQAEDAWLNGLADAAEAQGADGSVSLEEMAAALREPRG